MLLSPLCIRKFGKKKVLVVTNIMNVVFILCMLPFTAEIGKTTILFVAICMYLNNFMGAFIHVLNPAIQADIRDYQQYKTGERIDGMFSAVATIGTVITLITSAVLPKIYENGGITVAKAKEVTSNPEILKRLLADGKTVGQILQEQLANGQDNFSNAYSALYDPEILTTLLHVLILISAVGALMNVIPFFWYDFTERKQKSIVRVLKVRAMFEDYSNDILDDGALVEAIDIIRSARKNAALEMKEISKKDCKSVSGKEEKKAAKQAYKAALELNEEIEISKFVCDEIDKFDTALYQYQLKVSTEIYEAGLSALRAQTDAFIAEELKKAKALPQGTEEEKEIRKYAVKVAKKRKASVKAIKRYFPNEADFVEPDFEALDKMFEKEDALNDKIKEFYLALKDVKNTDRAEASLIKAQIKELEKQVKAVKAESKAEMDRHAYFARAAKIYLDAEKVVKQAENYTHFDEIAAQYDEAKARHEAELQRQKEEAERIKAEEDELARQLKAEKEKEKADKKADKKNKDKTAAKK